MSIQSTLNWPHVWLRIARERVQAAQHARTLYGSNLSGALDGEFDAALGAISAAAFAIEAEKIRVLGPGKIASTPPTRPWKLNVGDYLGQHLLDRGLIDAATSLAIGNLFNLRHESVHPVAVQQPLTRHPVGTNTSRELVAYNADVADRLVNIAAKVIPVIAP